MNIYKETISFLNTDAGIVSKFGTRIQPLKIEDNISFPYVILRDVSTGFNNHMQGQGNERYLLQIDIFDENMVDLISSTDLIKNKLSGYRGVYGNWAVGYVKIRNVFDMSDPNIRVFKRVLEVEVVEHQASIPN